MKQPSLKMQVKNVAAIVESCRKLISAIGTPLQNEQLPKQLQDAVKALGKAHAALSKAETLFKKQYGHDRKGGLNVPL